MASFWEVVIADNRFRGDGPLTYAAEQNLQPLSLVSVPLKDRLVYGFVVKKVARPKFVTKKIATIHPAKLPGHGFRLAEWLANYYACSLSEAIRQFAPSGVSRKKPIELLSASQAGPLLSLSSPLTSDQSSAIARLEQKPSGGWLLHGDTGTGKTRVYLELAAKTLAGGRSVVLLTPEIALVPQLATFAHEFLGAPVFILHSQLSPAQRKKIWLAIANSTEPIVVIGPRSALFAPVARPGLIVLDEAHEPAYKQDSSPYYHTSRVASQLGKLTGAQVILGTATPLVTDYLLADSHDSIVRLTKPAVAKAARPKTKVIDLKNKAELSTTPYFSRQLLAALSQTLAAKKQALIYLNRRGSARLVLCSNCGWRQLCPNCDISMVYHADSHRLTCHTCGTSITPPTACPVCRSPDIIYRSGGTKAIADELERLFPHHKIRRFDSDNPPKERIEHYYEQLRRGEIDIMVGTQLLAKGLDLPKLGLVGVINADTSLSLPDFTASERAYQLLYQVSGRVGRHGGGNVIVQTYEPNHPAILAAVSRDWQMFYDPEVKQRKQFGFPPARYLLKLTCRRSSSQAAKKAALELKTRLDQTKMPIETVGPTPSFKARRGKYHYWQLVVKSSRRQPLVEIAGVVGSNWSIDLDPVDLL